MMTLLGLASLATFGVAHAASRLIAGKEPWTTPSFVINHNYTHVLQSLSWTNLRNMGLIFDGCHQSHKALPPGGTFDEIGRPLHGWMTAGLPYLEQNQLYDAINLEIPWDDPANAKPFQKVLIFYRNVKVPVQYNRDDQGYALSHYAGNAHVLGGDRAWKLEEIKDGAAQTIMVGEAAGNFRPWGDPVNWRDPALGINKSPEGFGSPFPGGAQVLFADGSVHFIKDTIDPKVLKALGTPDGGETISADQF
jgi:prepilin-type processing-associated H-X9-DG protein